MIMDGIFTELNDKDKFMGIIGEHLRTAPQEIAAIMICVNVLDESRLEYAFGEYQQNIEKFAVLLDSQNPDHCKRSGALLHALYSSRAITDTNLEYTSKEIQGGVTRVRHGDAIHVLPFVAFYEEFANEMLAFDFAYGCCSAYEPNPTTYDFDYLHNVCRYLKANTNLNVESLFMLFKSLMLK